MQHRGLILVAVSAFLLSACGVATEDTSEGATADPSPTASEPVGSAEEPASDPNADTIVTLPHQLGFKITDWVNSKRFVFGAATSVRVDALTHWGNPGICRVPTYTITMMSADGRGEGLLTYHVGTIRPEIKSFQNVPPGKHFLHVEVNNPDGKRCTLFGTLTISVT